ncbi:MAG: hypothetical protein IJH79_09225, partial [Lentisphaeria bacterium]|nr:hypothetical protein [Lentisphaeria bacterium]
MNFSEIHGMTLKNCLLSAVGTFVLLAGSILGAADKVQLEKSSCYLTEKGGSSSAVIGADKQSAE